ncbi:MAG: histidine-type phosphatase [Anaerolineaceae bacterium]|nr:histidine-type phosphatase [Anaerolineaceae bacterium]
MTEKLFSRIIVFAVLIVLLMGTVVSFAEDTGEQSLSREGYTLEQVVILSRHNIRSPLSGKGSVLGEITAHDWFPWSSEPSELSIRGGVLETELGQYFRKWLELENLISENYRPDPIEVRFYANSKQRTIATAQYFSSGFLPVANALIEHHAEYDTMDPVFLPGLTFVSDAYREYAEAEIRAQFTEKINDLSDNYALITDVIDMVDSNGYKNGSVSAFRTDDTEIILNADAEPAMKGSLKTACSVADALVLQYYEEPDEIKAAFGHQLSFEDWKKISEIKDLYNDVLFTSPLVSANVAHPLLQEIRNEMEADGRLFTFLCGHDSNVGSVLAALGVEDYELPNSIELKTPIGCKLVFTKWSDAEGKDYWGVDLVYLNPDQLRTMPLLGLDNGPMIFPISFEGLDQVQAGLYNEADLLERFDQSIAVYDTIVEEYADTVSTEVPEPAVAK